MDREDVGALRIILNIAMFAVFIFVAGLWGCPRWNVYNQRMNGESQLAHAEYSKKVQVQDALGKLEAAKSLAQAEVERAKGVAQANAIIGDSLKNNEAYLKWLYIEGLKERTGIETIYVPTEAGLPILEAGRKGRKNESSTTD